jgi:hypothetical protein
VTVLGGEKPGSTKGRFWPYIGDDEHPYTVYDFTMTRARDGPAKFLANYEGYLQADAYGGYDGIFTGSSGRIVEVACWAHARRKFFEAKQTDGKRAATMLRLVGRLYGIERAIQARIDKRAKSEPTFTLAEQHALTQSIRRKRSARTLAKIKTWLDTQKHVVLPRSKMGEAFTYALNQWDALTRYTEQGYLNIDNNAAERALKRVAIGRKNWLFAGGDEAGRSHATLWTLIASAQRHGVDPQAYLRSVLAKIGQTKLSELTQFLPEKWKAEDAAARLTETNLLTPTVTPSA